ncbi:hypothetical protein BH24CHL5_BH24CHL5_07190 [soil metagenome]
MGLTDKDQDQDQDQVEDGAGPPEDDTEGHSLFIASDYHVQSRIGRPADLERNARRASELKEARPNKAAKR